MKKQDVKQGDFVRKNFNAIWPVHLAGFTKLLTQLRTMFEGDLDLLLIMAVIGERTRPGLWMSDLQSYRSLTRGAKRDSAQLPVNIQSIADYSGIPRETVRRKVAVLVGKGWVLRNAEGHLSVAPSAADDLQTATRDTVTYIAALQAAFESTRG